MEDIRKKAILDYLSALRKLKDLNIINNKRDFTSQLGEWLVTEIYNGKLAENGKQEDWDIQVNNELLQIKTHSKAKTTKRSDTDFKYSDNAKISYFVIIIFNENYKLEKIFKIPWDIALTLKTLTTKNPVIRWKDIPNKYSVNLKKEFLNNKLLLTFLEIE